MRLVALSLLVLAGCAATPEQMAGQSDYEVCRFTTGGPHSAVAHAEAQRRSLDCQPYYPAIMQQKAAQNAAAQSWIRSTQQPVYQVPQPINCTSYRIGNTVQTQCR